MLQNQNSWQIRGRYPLVFHSVYVYHSFFKLFFHPRSSSAFAHTVHPQSLLQHSQPALLYTNHNPVWSGETKKKSPNWWCYHSSPVRASQRHKTSFASSPPGRLHVVPLNIKHTRRCYGFVPPHLWGKLFGVGKARIPSWHEGHTGRKENEISDCLVHHSGWSQIQSPPPLLRPSITISWTLFFTLV